MHIQILNKYQRLVQFDDLPDTFKLFECPNDEFHFVCTGIDGWDADRIFVFCLGCKHKMWLGQNTYDYIDKEVSNHV